MKIVSIVLLSAFLSGCSILVPVKQKFPEAVPELKEKCPELLQLQGTQISITDMLKTVVQNYNTYYQCANKVEGWNEWYDKQKEIFDKVNKK